MLFEERFPHCTKFWHGPVDELHSIENKRDIVAIILLTLETGGVKTHSFLDEFSRFPQSGSELPQRASEEDNRQVRWPVARSLPGAHGARQSDRNSCREMHDRRGQETSQGQDGNPEALIGHSG